MVGPLELQCKDRATHLFHFFFLSKVMCMFSCLYTLCLRQSQHFRSLVQETDLSGKKGRAH